MGQLVSDVNKILEYQESKKSAENQRQKILAQMAEDEATKTNLIKKALATQRAKYGASGNTGNTMSENAVLKRLRDETAEPYDKKYKEKRFYNGRNAYNAHVNRCCCNIGNSCNNETT